MRAFRARLAPAACDARLPPATLYDYIAKGERMTSIKPPSSGLTGPHALPDTSDATSTVGSSGAASSPFQTSLDRARTPALAHTGATASSGSVTGAGADPVAQLAHAIDSGSVTLDEAVEQLLGHTLARAGKQLSAPQLAELSGMLREALQNDPTLSDMTKDRR
jgi:hypothetical protein